MQPKLIVKLLGGFQLIYDGQPLTGLNPRLQSLIAYLVLHAAVPQPRKRIAALLWPDASEEQARTNVRKYLHILRQALPDIDLFLEDTAAQLQWRPNAPVWFDVAVFQSAIKVGNFAEAIAAYPGDLLPDCYAEWVILEREQLQQHYRQALERLIQQREETRDFASALAYTQQLLALDPLREELHRHVMQLCAYNDDQAAVLRAYQNCATILRRELSVDPSPATRELFERLLGRRVHPLKPLVGTFPLIGRDAEWNRLLGAWRTAAQGRPMLVLISGEAGIGKTRLAEELRFWLNHQDLPVAGTDCYAPEGTLAYAPVAHWLHERPLDHLEPVWKSEIARLLPELLEQTPSLPAPGPLVEAWQRQRFHEALARAVLGRGLAMSEPLLLLIEDIQWCDRDTLAWLSYLLRFNPRARLLIAATLRCEAAHPDSGLPTLLNDLKRRGQLTEIELNPLDAAAATLLGEQAAGHGLTSDGSRVLYQETEGNPLFIVEFARAELETVSSTPFVAQAAFPARVQAAIAARFQLLTSQARQVLDTAAVIGREFTYELLIRTTAQPDQALVEILDELWQRRMIRERGQDAYDFSHDKLRQTAYAGLSTARRRMLHRRVAEALCQVHQNRLDPVSGQIAWHFEQAGVSSSAADWFWKAGDASIRVGAVFEGIDYHKRALALLAEEDSRRAELMLKIGSESITSSGYQHEDLIYQALQLARQRGDRQIMAQALLALGHSVSRRGENLECCRLCEEAMALAEALDDKILKARILVQLGLMAHYRTEAPLALTYLNECIALIHAVPPALSQETNAILSRAYNLIGLIYLQLKQYAEGVQYFREAVATGDPLMLAALNNNLGWAAFLQGDYAEVKRVMPVAVRLYAEQNDYGGVCTACNNIGYVALLEGDLAAARTHYIEGLRAAEKVAPNPVCLESLLGVAGIWVKTGQPIRAAELLVLVETHPQSHPDLALLSPFVRQAVEAVLPPDELAEATERGRTLDPYRTATDVLKALEAESV